MQNFCDFSLDAKHSITEILNSWCQIGTCLEIWYLSIYGNLYFAYMCILINTMDNIKLNLRHVYILLKYDNMLSSWIGHTNKNSVTHYNTHYRQREKNSLQIVAVNIFVYFKTCWSFREGTVRHIFVSFVVINNICK